MAAIDAQVSTGLSGLDRVFRGVMAGDNIVWQVDSVDDYCLAELLPNAVNWSDCVRVIDLPNAQCQAVLRLNANTLKQNVFCYLDVP